MAAGDTAAAEQAVRDAVVALDKAAQRGAIHPNNAARRKSRIMRQLHQSKSSEG
jgi:small subunit ribosomal protein S20